MDNNRVTLSGNPADPNAPDGAPQALDPRTGQYKDYWVLSEEERKKGWVRPFRNKYVHVGPLGPKYPLRDLTEEEHRDYDKFGYIKYEEYPEGSGETCCGSYWTQERLDKVGKGCGVLTVMGTALSETYARDPHFYGATFCVGCGVHLPVAEFTWDADGERVGS